LYCPLFIPVAFMVLSTSVALAAPFLSGPPPGFTGGFGEPGCAQCHFDGRINDAAGSLMIAGLPSRYEPGQTYTLKVTVTHPSLERGGFQVAARFAEGARAGRNAGVLSGDSARVLITAARNDPMTRYASHNASSTAAVAKHTSSWVLSWTPGADLAADDAVAAVVFHVAGNAANGDDSPFGDFIYMDSVRVPRVKP
jgi:hypothetical protein